FFPRREGERPMRCSPSRFAPGRAAVCFANPRCSRGSERRGGDVEYRLLGAFEVLDDAGRTVAISGAKARALLVQLLFVRRAVGPAVTMDRLTDGLRPVGAPSSAGGTIQAHVPRLRQILGGRGGRPSPLTSRKPGYALAVGPDELDLDRFEQLVAAASGAGAE